jgi:hypothetical protein
MTLRRDGLVGEVDEELDAALDMSKLIVTVCIQCYCHHVSNCNLQLFGCISRSMLYGYGNRKSLRMHPIFMTMPPVVTLRNRYHEDSSDLAEIRTISTLRCPPTRHA